MRRLFDKRSRSFRVVLGMALLAWTMLASGALTGSLRMFDAMGVNATMQVTHPQAATVHCDGMTMTHVSHALHPAPLHQPGNGHGCCHDGGCTCASLCSGIAGVPAIVMTWPPVHEAALSLIHFEPVLAHSAPLLRPPIA